MLAKFDPVSARQRWFDFNLEIETDFHPHTLAPRVRPGYVADLVNAFVEAYWLGLVDEVRPTLEKIITWMESEPELDLGLFSTKHDNWYNKWHELYAWQRTLGLCKWLSRGDGAETEFSRAMEIELHARKHPELKDAPSDQEERQQHLSQRLAVALAGGVPELGLELYEMTGVKRPTSTQKPLLQFGLWACRHLANGGVRDATFVAKGADMLRASLLPNFMQLGNRTEPGLWLKAIYFDSGVARTPEQALARAYDSMPGVTRPDFVPR